MEEASGSQINRIIGLGLKADLTNGKLESVWNSYPSYYRNVLQAFEHYPITKYFGITVEGAMELSVNKWHEMRNAAKLIAMNQPPDGESQLIEVIKELIIMNRGGGGE